MVYCNLVNYDDNKVTYDFGGDVSDISGRLEFYYKDSAISIIKEPDTEMAPIRHIQRLLRLKQPEFEKGIFKEKISYEC